MARTRVRIRERGRYLKGGSGPRFFTSGAACLDCVLGGGWPLGRVMNVVGDKSTGKTLLAIEAAANFNRTFPGAEIVYDETESAFDVAYAERVGLPASHVTHRQSATVEEWADAVTDAAARARKGQPILYVTDSLDAISDKAEMERSMDKGSFGAKKAKQLSEFFRKTNQRLARASMSLFVVSQIRDKFNVMFGEKHQRAGGHAMDFYASQVLWLYERGKIAVKVKGVQRVVGVNVRAYCKKNKVGLPFRECLVPVVFNFGVDDVAANIGWMVEHKVLPKDTKVPKPGTILWREARDEMAAKLKASWDEVESRFAPKGSKYG